MADEVETDAVVEAYKRDVDRGLLREALKLTHEQRIREMIELQRLSHELQRGMREAADGKDRN